ncbi:hypothetical protein [Flavobacterium sp. U410]|jgi:predicted permease
MKEKELTELTNQELLDKKEKTKSNLIINAVIIGVLIGVTIYSAVKNGFSFFTFFPLFFVYLIVKNGKNYKALEEELKKRNL